MQTTLLLRRVRLGAALFLTVTGVVSGFFVVGYVFGHVFLGI